MTSEQLCRKYECELSFEYFVRYFFKVRYGQKMIIGQHHKVFFEIVEKVYKGLINRLIVNVPPGFTKTEIFVISFIAWGLALNSQSRFLHLSSSDSLALENSSKTRELINTEEYQNMWPLKMKDDSDSKKKWWTLEGGGMYAGSAGGQVMGFRAGHMFDGFTGCMIIDDPNKPDDAFTVELDKMNRRINNTTKSRLAREDVPIIIIQQRIHKDDVSGYLLKGGTKEKWTHCNLPVVIDNRKHYKKMYTYGVQYKHNLPSGWLWPAKLNESHRDSLMAHKLTFNSQYMQEPEKIDIKGALWRQEIIDKFRLTEIPRLKIVTFAQGVDPSGDYGKDRKPDKDPDAIGDVIAGVDQYGEYYVMNDGTMNGSPQEWSDSVIRNYFQFDCTMLVYENNYGGAMVEHTIRTAHGGDTVRMMDVTASRGKLLRAEPVSVLYAQGKVHHVGYFPELENQMCTYNGMGKSPNNLDALVFVITYLHDYVANMSMEALGSADDYL